MHAMVTGTLTSKPYGWVTDAGFTVVEVVDGDGSSTFTLLCKAADAVTGETRLVRVLAIEDFYEALQKVHDDSGHARGRPLEDKAKKGLPRCRGGQVISW